MKSSDLEFPVEGKPVQAYLAEPEAGGPGVLILHAWWGLKPFFKQVCDRLAGAGFVALAPDLNGGQIATTVDEAMALKQKLDDRLIGETVKAARERLLEHPAVTRTQIGVMGFSMGAAWTLVSASEAPDQVRAAVLYYGIYPFDYSKIRAKVLGHFAETDEWEPLDGVKEVEASLKQAGVPTEFHVYPGCRHWFVEEDRPEFNAGAAGQAWERSLAFLHTNLG